LHDGCEHQHAFHPGEALADTVARASAEGEVSESGAFGLGFDGETAGVEAHGIGPPARVVVHDKLRGDEVRAFGDAFSGAHGVVLDGGAGDDPGGGIEAHRFGEDALEVFELAEVRGLGEAIAADGSYLVAHTLLDFGMPGHLPERKGEGVGGGLVAGEEDGEGFVADLAVRHGAGVVHGFEQHAEQIVAEHPRLAAAANDAEDEFVKRGEGAAHAGHGADGKAFEQTGAGQEREGQIVVEDLHGVDKSLDAGVDVGAEQTAAGDAEGEAHHLGVHLEERAFGRPASSHLAGEPHDLGAVTGDARPVKRRLSQSALTQMEGFFAGEEAVAEDTAGAAQDYSAKMVGGVAHQEIGDEIRVVELELAKAVGCEEADEIAEADGVLLIKAWGVDCEESSIPDPTD